MNQPTRFVKVAVIASSIVLASAFILYRSGVLRSLTESDVNIVTESSTPGDATTSSAATSGAETVMHLPDTPLSKPPSNAPAKDTTKRRSRFLGGSKSGVPMIEPPTTNEPSAMRDTTDNAIDTAHVRRNVMMGGSKSLAPMIPPPGAQQSQKESGVNDTAKKRNKR